MTSTIIRNSIVGDQWIMQSLKAVPIQRVINPETGLPTGSILTGPVRLNFPELFRPPEKKANQTSEPKYGTGVMFTPAHDLTILYEEWYAMMGKVFPEYYDAQTQQYQGLENPFLPQDRKVRYAGYTPGAIQINCTSKFKPSIVDVRQNIIVDESKVYPGVWAICSINAYAYGKSPPQPKKGIAFGLESVMIIGDDTRLGEGGVDPKKVFGGVNVTAPIVRPDMVAGMGATPPAPPAYGGQPARPMPPAAPMVPQTRYAPPAPPPAPVQGYPQPGFPHAQPAAPVYGQPPAYPAAGSYAQPAMTSPSEDDNDMSWAG